MIVGLPELKAHLREDADDEDALIRAYAGAAEEQVSSWIGRPIYRAAEDLPATGHPAYHPDQIVATEAIKVSIMMITANLFGAGRAGTGTADEAAVPPASVRAMLAGLRVFSSMGGDRADR